MTYEVDARNRSSVRTDVRGVLESESTPSANGCFVHIQIPHTEPPRFIPPPGEEASEIKSVIDKAQALLEAGGTSPTNLLTNPDYMTAHEWPRFRKLIRQYARSDQTVIVTPQEPGEPLVVSGTVRNRLGEPVKGALIYVYQTSSKGWYSAKALHISGNSGDEKYARLFAYLATNERGQYEFRTVRPAGYPGSNLPAHIHIEIQIAGDNTRSLISEIQFADDARLTDEMRARSLHEGFFISPVKRDASGVQRVNADFKISMPISRAAHSNLFNRG